jgi:recombination protein RecA
MANTTETNKKKPGKAVAATETHHEVPAEQIKALEIAFGQIDKRFGKGTVMMFGQKPKMKIDVVPTGSLLLNKALGVGGFPRGRILEVFGPEASGKTTIALHAIAQAQAAGGVCAFIDAEHALDSSYAQGLGVNLNSLVISQPDFGEQALDIAEMLIRSGAVDLVVIDSVAALVPKAEIDGDMGDVHVGLQARLMSQALRKLTPIINKSKTVLIFINQIRHKINAMAFANKETTSGGNALKFYASVRLDVRKISSLKKGEELIGNRVCIKVVKNKVAPPFVKVEVDLIFGKGICQYRELVEMAVSYGIIKQSGAWFSYKGEKICQGKESLIEKITSEPLFFQEIYAQVKSELDNEVKMEYTGADLINEEGLGE